MDTSKNADVVLDSEIFDDSFKKGVNPPEPVLFDEIWQYLRNREDTAYLISYSLIEPFYEKNKKLFLRAILDLAKGEAPFRIAEKFADLTYDIWKICDYRPSKELIANLMYGDDVTEEQVNSELVACFWKRIPDCISDVLRNLNLELVVSNYLTYLDKYSLTGLNPIDVEYISRDRFKKRVATDARGLANEIHEAMVEAIYSSCTYPEIAAWVDGEYDLYR